MHDISAQTLSIAGPDTTEHGVPASALKLVVSDDPGERLVTLLQERGGKLFCGQRSLATALGISVTSANTLLHTVAQAGRIKVTTSKRGTILELLQVAA